MKSSVRSYDSVGRYGGEEFLLVLPGCSSRMAAERAEQIRFALCEPSPDRLENQITVSMGIAEAKGPTKMDELLCRADDALYRAKRNGRNRVESIEDTLNKTDDQATEIAASSHS